jgi:hypothetical protein
MIIIYDGELRSASEDDLEGTPKLNNCNDLEYVIQWKSLVIRRSLSISGLLKECKAINKEYISY